jgi:hypothetical protein
MDQTRPKNYLIESILVMLCCCQPLGIVGIVFASQVNSKFASGDYIGAQQASKDAKKWITWGFIAGLIIMVGVLLLYGTVILAAFSNGNFNEY